MRLTDLLALSHVPRWSIVDCVKPQSVGEHVFRVLVIATELAERLKIELSREALLYILSHDATECRTGDIPTPAKEKIKALADSDTLFCPWLTREWAISLDSLTAEEAHIFALADRIEATTFIHRHGIGPHARRAALSLRESVDDICLPEWRETVRAVVQLIDEDAER